MKILLIILSLIILILTTWAQIVRAESEKNPKIFNNDNISDNMSNTEEYNQIEINSPKGFYKTDLKPIIKIRLNGQ